MRFAGFTQVCPFCEAACRAVRRFAGFKPVDPRKKIILSYPHFQGSFPHLRRGCPMQKVSTKKPREHTSLQVQTLLTLPVVAQMLCVSRPTVYWLIDNEGLPVIRLGRSVRVSPVSLQNWLTEHEHVR
jgi:excisionase family DNA binding protein